MSVGGCIYARNQYMVIFWIAPLAACSSLWAMYQHYYDLSFVCMGVYLTSVNYWRKPDYSWRRYVDMIAVKVAFAYHLFCAYGAEYCVWYIAFVCAALFSYYMGIVLFRQNLIWLSVFAHCMLHVFANVGNYVLYSGYLNPARGSF